MKRINFNFKYGKYTGSSKTLVGEYLFFLFSIVDVVDDCTLLGQLGKDINKDKDLFLMNEYSFSFSIN